mmetsp:Transcript_88237/g.129004  ORF Transcript_88237/g.129004 Transcript_88237/m.129004 type:complete len:271 (-) Transcript_88237:70-882(-)
MLLPHTSMQVVCPQTTLLQTHPSSSAQFLHPSPSMVLPSSQSSFPATIESPQVVVQVSAVCASPPTHRYPHSTVHIAEHPSPGVMSPSSQKFTMSTSAPSVKPSPHSSLPVCQMQVDGLQSGLEHSYPLSMVQPWHPSPASELPSSHASEVVTTLLPHDSKHEEARPTPLVLLHVYPQSTVHVSEHPSPGAPLSPSSQASSPTFRPSPQIAMHVVCSQTVLVQVHPASSVQMLLQPSLLATLLSSQASPVERIPSPHTESQVCGSASSQI